MQGPKTTAAALLVVVSSVASSTVMLSSPSPQSVLEKAKQAELRLRVALQHVQECRQPQPQVRMASTRELVEKTTTTSSVDTAAEVPRIVALEWPFVPLTERAKEKDSRDVQRQRRRAARQATAAAAAQSLSMSAADVMRNTLSQPLGKMAARLLSAATAGAPSLFSEPAAHGHVETTVTAHNAVSSPPAHVFSSSVANTTTATTAAAVRSTEATTRTPSSPSRSPYTGGKQSTSPRPGQRHGRHYTSYSRHHHHRGGSPLSSSPMLASSGYVGGGDADARLQTTSLLALLTSPLSPKLGSSTPYERRDVPNQKPCLYRLQYIHRHRKHHSSHCRHSRPSSKPVALGGFTKKNTLLASSVQAQSTPTSAQSSAHPFFSTSSISILARTFGSGGEGGGSNNPRADNDRVQRKSQPASPQRKTPAAADIPATTPAVVGGVQVNFSSSPSSTGHHPPLSSRLCSEVSSSCSCSSSSCCSDWCGSSCTPSNTNTSCSASSLATFFYPMTAPGPDGAYDPRAPLPSLLRCYGDAETRNLFHDVASTSSKRTESRSSTPFSSEWSAGTSSTNADLTTSAVAAANSGQHPIRDEGVGRCHTSPLLPHHHRHDTNSIPSPTTHTQLSVVTEMDAIEKGKVAPYMSYLFTPEARVVDLRRLEKQLPQREPSPPVAATCIRFCQAGNVYLVGTSSGLLWRVPVGGGQEEMRATPLGSLWPPHAPTGGNVTSVGVGPLSAPPGPLASHTAAATVAASNAITTSPNEVLSDVDGPAPSSSSSQPVPLSGHTAAILSIAFNDDGTLYVTAGLDGCVIVWKASTSAKLRRISAVWANASAEQRAPHLVRFMPHNNNYLLVSYVDSSELHLYNSSTGLPVTNVAGTGLTRMPVGNSVSSGGVAITGSDGSKQPVKGGSRTSKGNRGGGGSSITALAVHLIASPFFVSGDTDGTVMLWTYRAGDMVAWPTLRATSTQSPSSDGGGGVNANTARHSRSQSHMTDFLGYSTENGRDDASHVGGGTVFSTPHYQLPELRRVSACALPLQAGGVAAISLSILHTAQLHSLFRPCGSPNNNGAASAREESDNNGEKEHIARAEGRHPHHPLDATAKLFHAAAVQNCTCREELDARQAEEEEAAATAGDIATGRSRRDTHTKSSSTLRRKGNYGSSIAKRANVSSSNSSFQHILAGLPSRLSETFSALWGGSGGNSGSHGASCSPSVSTMASRRTDSSFVTPKSATNSAVTSSFDPAVMTEKELLKQLRSDALDVVCPLLILVTAPCDTVYALGLLLQMQHGNLHHGNSSSGTDGHHHNDGMSKPTVSYRLYPLLKTTGPSRMRHVGVGAVVSPDNHRLVVVAAPCEEGFVRVLPLLRVEAAATATKTDTTPLRVGCGTAKSGGENMGSRIDKKHVLATLPMPYGGRCTGIAWSPSGRFLVAITAEGVIYEWSRVYLLGTTTPKSNNKIDAVAASRAMLRATTGPTERGTAPGSVRDNGDGVDASPENVLTTSAAKNVRMLPADVDVAAATAAAAARWRGCRTESSETVHRPAPTLNFSSLLGTPMAAPATATVATATAVVAEESDAARAAFSEEDAWRKSFQRELERQRREQAALKLVARSSDGNGNEVGSSGYWLENDSPEGSFDTFADDDAAEQNDVESAP